jgi:hypothetical protein
VPVSTNVMSSKPVHGEVYSIQQYVIPAGDSETNNQSSCQDNLLSENNNDTIPLSQGHALSNCKIANMSKKNPDPGYCMYLDPVSFYLLRFFSSVDFW